MIENARDPLLYDPNGLDYNVALAKFFFSIQDHFTNEEMIKIDLEVAVLYG